MKKSTHMESKLKVYASLAMGVAGIGLVNGQIVYTDVNPDVVITTVGDSLGIDFDADGILDYSIRRFDWGGVATNTAVIGRPEVTGNGGMGTMGTTIPYLSALALNAPIGSAGPWQIYDGIDTQQNKQGFASTYSGAFYGNFGDNAEHYVGVMLQPGGASVNYGWIRVSGIPQDGSSVTIMDFAYNTVADASINAGQMTVDIDENVLVGKVFSNNGSLIVRLSNADNGKVTVYNSVGQVVIAQDMESANTVIDMNAVEMGIYNVVVESNGMILQKKVTR